MTKRNVESMMAWLRRVYPPTASHINADEVFALAMKTCCREESAPQLALCLMAYKYKGKVPYFVQEYFTKYVYPATRSYP